VHLFSLLFIDLYGRTRRGSLPRREMLSDRCRSSCCRRRGTVLSLELTLAVPSATDIVCLRHLQLQMLTNVTMNARCTSSICSTTAKSATRKQTENSTSKLEKRLKRWRPTFLGDKATIKSQQHNTLLLIDWLYWSIQLYSCQSVQ